MPPTIFGNFFNFSQIKNQTPAHWRRNTRDRVLIRGCLANRVPCLYVFPSTSPNLPNKLISIILSPGFGLAQKRNKFRHLSAYEHIIFIFLFIVTVFCIHAFVKHYMYLQPAHIS